MWGGESTKLWGKGKKGTTPEKKNPGARGKDTGRQGTRRERGVETLKGKGDLQQRPGNFN